MSPLRVLHAPAAVGGHAPALARAERALGLDSRCVVFEQPPAGYAVDEVLAPRGTGSLRREVRRWRLILSALRDYDVVHFNFGSPLTPRRYPASVTGRRGPAHALYGLYARAFELRDLPLLKRAGKAIFVTYQGDDARRAELAPALGAGYYDPTFDRRKQEWVAVFDRYADGIYALNPDLLRALPARARFLPYASVDLDRWQPVPPRPDGAPLVVHAPTDRRAKGTEVVLAALERLRADGVSFELVLVEGVTRAQARSTYERADLLVDQVLIGWYGGVAVELMALGKPVVAYIREEDLHALPAEMRAELPVIRAGTDDLREVLREWLTARRAELPAIGSRSRAYVERWHDPRAIAARVRRDYESALERPQ